MAESHILSNYFEISDSQQWERYDVGKLLKRQGSVCEVRLYKNGSPRVEMMTRGVHIVGKSKVSCELTAALQCIAGF